MTNCRDFSWGLPRWLGAGALALCGETEGLLSPEERRFWGDLTAAFLYPWGGQSRRWHSDAWQGDSGRTLKSTLYCYVEKLFQHRDIQELEKVAQRLCCLHPLEAFKIGLDKALSNLFWLCSWPYFEQDVGLEISWVLFLTWIEFSYNSIILYY